MPALEANVEAAWFAKQTAKGTPAAAAMKRGRKVGGGMSVARDDGTEQYSDGARFASGTDFVNTVLGNGNPILQAQPGVVGALAYLMLGQETVTGVADPYTHVATPAGSSFWTTWWKKVGSTVVLRQKFNDSRITSLRIEGSSANKVVKVTPTFLSIDPGEIYTTEPTQAEDADVPFVYTEAEGTFTIDGTVFRGHSSCAVVIGDALNPWYGDSTVPHEVVTGLGQVTLENVTLLVDQQGLEQYNKIVYGAAAPAAGTKPVKTTTLGSYSFNLTRGANRQIMVEVPSVKWEPPESPEGNPEGGAVEIQLGGQARKASGQPVVRVTTKSADAAYV